ncbi:gluconate 2-dehydrogenase subunit 3 family protein [Brevibacillus ruminantium]|uniref:Gluconate 2-dehydrogenase subunit 3 family protein n=1 Tax=Brevibacillus ruminantium TaxID=2950604 RepID=A0ABY4WGQ0_9BACL|nr:gluconate 2-dehydrogenase subunit 3 family protein [Brevibacillus ruminantium]USG66335.1 gluconate 2-dehydrogenase subunit 3 family protein [Brevibacillus ruminantium]
MAKNSHYPAYDVWEEHSEWDPHTRKIVGSRKTPQVACQFLTKEESMLLQTIVSVLVDEHRLEVLTYVTQHLDESLASPIGESQRKVGLPPKKELFRMGLAGINEESHFHYHTDFIALKREEQQTVLEEIAANRASHASSWSQVQAKDFFQKLLHDTVSAYYSHPLVWSDIGYGGPAYPRGYVRVEKGLTDPWEAKADGKS